MQAAGLRIDQAVDVREDGGAVVIEPITPESYDLQTMIAGITDENRHEPIEPGDPQGCEAW